MTEEVLDNAQQSTLFRLFVMILLSALGVGLAYAVLSIPTHTVGLQQLTEQHLENSGVSHPVTAVLLNYRAYDTLLEMGVVLLALIAVWSLGSVPQQNKLARNPVLDMLAHLLSPLLILVSGYLLWVGAHAPGGAFQAGALLAAAGVLLFLSGWNPSPRFTGLPLRIALIAGLCMFVVVGAAVMLTGQVFLEYPLAPASSLILLIEAAATLAIGFTLAALFIGDQPESLSNWKQKR